MESAAWLNNILTGSNLPKGNQSDKGKPTSSVKKTQFWDQWQTWQVVFLKLIEVQDAVIVVGECQINKRPL